MKHAVLDTPYVRFGKMCSDIDQVVEIVSAKAQHRKVPL